MCSQMCWFSTLRPWQNGCNFPYEIVRCIFLNENIWISLKISLNFVHKFKFNNIPALVQIMTWRQPGDKSLSEPMLVRLLTHIWVIRPQWVRGPAFIINHKWKFNQLPWKIWPSFRIYFQMHFLEWNVLCFDSNFTEVCSRRSNLQCDSLVFGNGLAPNRQQAINWTDADTVHWRIYASPGGDELSTSMFSTFRDIMAVKAWTRQLPLTIFYYSSIEALISPPLDLSGHMDISPRRCRPL